MQLKNRDCFCVSPATGSELEKFALFSLTVFEGPELPVEMRLLRIRKRILNVGRK
jgi:hypothetical protein